MRGVVLLCGAVIATVLTASAIASDEIGVTATIHRYIEGNNKNDQDLANALCDEQAVIVDIFPPYLWQGAGSCAQWWNDANAYDVKNGVTEQLVTADKPW